MTWIVAANCSNGLICAADIQATIIWNDERENEYYNCVQKIHKVWDNLCVAFSGDIKSGLLMIDQLKADISKSIKEGDNFDLVGQAHILEDALRIYYKQINKDKMPDLELIFIWYGQEDNDDFYRPFASAFKAPYFNRNSISFPGLYQSGSGKGNQAYQDIISKISTELKAASETSYSEGSKRGTVTEIINILFNNIHQIDYLGVSQSFVSYQSLFNNDNLMLPDSEKYKEILNMVYPKGTISHTRKKLIDVNPNIHRKAMERIEMMKHSDPNQFKHIKKLLQEFVDSGEKIQFYCEKPSLQLKQYISSNERIDTDYILEEKTGKKLHYVLANWDDFVKFFAGKKITFSNCSAKA